MLQPATGGAIRRAIIGGGNVPLPEERYELVVQSIGAAGLEDDASVVSLFDGRLGIPITPASNITLAFPSSVCAAGPVRGLEIALGVVSNQPAGTIGARLGIRFLTRTFRLLQVVQPLELPGIPTMIWSGRLTSSSHLDTKSKVE